MANIVVSNGNTLVTGSSSADSIIMNGVYEKVTINAGKGDDTIDVTEDVDIVFNYANGDGNDVINSGGNILLNITSGSITGFDSYQDEDENSHLIVKVGSGSIEGRNGDLKIYNNGNGANIFYNSNPYYDDESQNGDDFIYFDENFDLESYLEGTSENNGRLSITGGAGNDTIFLYPEILPALVFNAGDGNDVVYNYGSELTVAVYNDVSYVKNAKLNGNDMVLTITNDVVDSTITLKNFDVNYIDLNIYKYSYGHNGWERQQNTKIYAGINNYGDTSVAGTSSADLIYNMASSTIHAGNGNDTIINDSYNATINAGKGNDTIYADKGKIIYTSGDGNDVVNLSGNSVKYTADDGQIEIDTSLDIVLAANTSISSASYKDNDHTLNIGSGSIIVKNVDMNSTVSKLNVQTTNSDGSYTYWKYINGKAFNRNGTFGEYGELSADSTGTNQDDYINVYSYDEGEGGQTIQAAAGNDYIEISGYNGQVKGETGNDTIVSNEAYSTEIDGGEGNDLIQIVGGSHYNDEGETTGESNISINGGSGDDVIEIQQYSQKTTGYDDEGTWKTDIREDGEFGTKATINAGAGNDTIRNAFINIPTTFTQIYENHNTDYGDVISEQYTLTSAINTMTNTLTQIKSTSDGSNNSTVVSSMIYDRLIQYADGDGDDVVEDYNVGDTIQVTEGTIDSKTASGVDVILKIGEGSITLKNAANKELTIINADGSTTKDTVEAEVDVPKGLTYNETWTAVTIDSNYGNKLKTSDYLSSVISIDASKRGKAINIIGNSNYNSIVGSTKNDTLQGGDGDDTLIGGKGKDSLIGGDGNDVFIYADGDGYDIISDFQTGDSIKLIDGEISKITTSSKNSNVILTIGKGKVTLKGAKDESIIVNHANGLISTIQGGGQFNAITNNISEISISGDFLNDSIANYADGSSSELDGGAGKDTIDNYAISVIINGDSDNDNINNFGNRATINGGAGNDTIFLNIPLLWVMLVTIL